MMRRQWGRFWWWVFADVTWRFACRWHLDPCVCRWWQRTPLGYWLDLIVLRMANPYWRVLK